LCLCQKNNTWFWLDKILVYFTILLIANDDFHSCLIVIKIIYCSFHKIKKKGVQVKTLLDGHLIDLKCFFKRWLWLETMKQSWKRSLIWTPSLNCGPKLVYMPSSSTRKFIKLVEITHVLGSMEDECCFSIVVFIKNKIRKHLTCHLDLCTWLCAIANFPFEKAINLQANTKWWYYVDSWNHMLHFEWQLHFIFQALGCGTLHFS
jgi:hypothetical protein